MKDKLVTVSTTLHPQDLNLLKQLTDKPSVFIRELIKEKLYGQKPLAAESQQPKS